MGRARLGDPSLPTAGEPVGPRWGCVPAAGAAVPAPWPPAALGVRRRAARRELQIPVALPAGKRRCKQNESGPGPGVSAFLSPKITRRRRRDAGASGASPARPGSSSSASRRAAPLSALTGSALSPCLAGTRSSHLEEVGEDRRPQAWRKAEGKRSCRPALSRELMSSPLAGRPRGERCLRGERPRYVRRGRRLPLGPRGEAGAGPALPTSLCGCCGAREGPLLRSHAATFWGGLLGFSQGLGAPLVLFLSSFRNTDARGAAPAPRETLFF